MDIGQLILALVKIQETVGAFAKVRVSIDKNGKTVELPATSVVYDDRAVTIAHERREKKELH